MSLKLNSSGGGSVTLSEPTTASNRTVNIPDADTTLVGTNVAQTLTNKTLTAPSVDVIKSTTTSPPTIQNSAGTEIGTLCRAWVNFNGSTAAIRASFNVSSVTRNGTGDYTVNFSSALPDVNYAPSIQRGGATSTGSGGTGVGTDVPSALVTISTSSLRIACFTYVGSNNGRSYADDTYVNVSIFR